ncbi:hypothetical protein ACVW0K_006579 [Streptomyces filamentosus]
MPERPAPVDGAGRSKGRGGQRTGVAWEASKAAKAAS